MRSVLGVEERFDFFNESLFGSCAHTFVHDLTVLEEENGGHAADAEARGEFDVVVHVTFANDDATFIFFSKFFDDGRNLLAGTTPSGREVNDDGKAGGFNFSNVGVSNDFFLV